MLTMHPGTDITALELAIMLHPADAAELDAAGQCVERVLQGVKLTELRNGTDLVCAFGLQPGDGYGVPWMLCTSEVERVPRHAMAAVSRRVVDGWKAEHAMLMNLVHAHNQRAIRFVQWLGFTVDRRPCGPGGEFFPFWWRRNV